MTSVIASESSPAPSSSVTEMVKAWSRLSYLETAVPALSFS